MAASHGNEPFPLELGDTCPADGLHLLPVSLPPCCRHRTLPVHEVRVISVNPCMANSVVPMAEICQRPSAEFGHVAVDLDHTHCQDSLQKGAVQLGKGREWGKMRKVWLGHVLNLKPLFSNSSNVVFSLSCIH